MFVRTYYQAGVVFTTNQYLMKSILLYVSCHKEWMIDNAVVPVATAYGLAKEYEYLKGSIREFLTGFSFSVTSNHYLFCWIRRTLIAE
jgi:ubiquinone/menaquinone biosynthesis C-methylase UbiE